MQVEAKQPLTPSISQTTGPSPSTTTAVTSVTDSFEKPPAGKMIQQEGGARFIDSQLWTSFYDEV